MPTDRYEEIQRRAADLEREIAERRRAEEALRRREELFRALVEKSAEAIALVAADGKIVYVSPSVTQLSGLSAEEKMGRDAFENIHPDDLPRVQQQFVEFLAHPGTVVTTKCRFRHRDGAWHTLEAIATNRVDDPNVGAIVVNFRDITDRQQAEEALRQSEEKLRQITENTREVMWLVNRESTQVLYVSPAYQEIWGRSCQSLYEEPRSWLEAIHPEDRPSVLAALEERARGQITSQEYRVLRPGGSVRLVRDRAFPIKDASGRVTRVAGVAEDVTAERRLEDQFRQSQKLEAIGRLAGGVAHDFNNLLTIITGYNSLVLGSLRPGDPLHAFAQHIKGASDRAAALTRQLLAFSRKQVLQPEVLDLNGLITDMEKMLSRLIGEDIDLKVTPGPQLWRVKADPGQIEQVIMNLAVNARDAMPQGGKLTIETRNVELDDSYVAQHPYARAGHHVLLAVSDTGCGMDAATKARIFEPFFTTKGPEKGTGLGLAAVYGIVKQSGGHIGVYSEPGLGATFKIYLPRAQEPVRARKSLPGLSVSLRGTESLLLVEDEEGVRELARTVLEKHGYKVLAARSGGEALLMVERHPDKIHLMVTDVVMPEMSGPQLTNRLATLRPEIKVLYLSGYTDDAIVHHGVLDADTPFLQKPFTPEALARKVREVLDERAEA